MIGKTLGTYHIVAKLGEGGMGEVYRAHDAKLGRDVAIKILPDVFARDPERVARFEREARALAALNHPNIAAIYGTESAGPALVMELVEGEDLARRIDAGPVPIAEALRIARQIASALEAAHEAGIIHRDLKPANIKVKDDGTVKVLDFGLAKAMDPASSPGDPSGALSNSPTLTGRATQLGVILGTAAYMAPEQAKGRAVDRRADAWAFGVVLYEMLTGRRLFDASDVSETLAAVLTREPEWTLLPAGTPASVRRLLARCLVKDRSSRLDSMRVAQLDLDEAIAAPDAPPPATRTRPSLVAASALVAGGLVAGALIARYAWTGPAPASGETSGAPIVTSIAAAPEALSAFVHGFALSPDGSTLVYVGRQADGTRQLWKRRLADARAELLPGTEGATHPFWSPDGLQVGFFIPGAMKSVPIGGGPARTITAVEFQTGYDRASWSGRNEILFSTNLGPGIQRVHADGGRPVKLPIDGNVFDPQWLPDGRHFLVVRSDGKVARLLVADAEAANPPVEVLEFDDVVPINASARYATDGFLIFNRAGVLSMQRFNAQTFKTEGPVTPLGDPAGAPRTWFPVSAARSSIVALNPSTRTAGGTPGDPVAKLLWVNRQGEPIAQVGPEARYWSMRLSPDGRRAIVNSDHDIWSMDTTTSLRTRVARAAGAVWMPDSQRLVYRQSGRALVMPVTGEGKPQPIFEFKERPMSLWAISADGSFFVGSGRGVSESTRVDLFVVSIADGSVRPLVESTGNDSHAALDASGRWLAYTSDSTGRQEVYVRRFDSKSEPIRVSADGGVHPAWRSNGRELFYLSPTDQLVVVDVSALDRTGAVGATTVLFRKVLNDITRDVYPPYAVAPDGHRFLINVPAAQEPVTLIQLRR